MGKLKGFAYWYNKVIILNKSKYEGTKTKQNTISKELAERERIQ
jgi:hypothetical protein